MQLHLVVSGLVQGVWFRKSTRDKATDLALCGWVRNLPDGRVEILAAGSEGALLELQAWCHHGPPLARVDEVEGEWLESTEALPPFFVKR